MPAVEVSPFRKRDLVEVALENAVEGCVGETYGALVAAFQAVRAAPTLLFREIARDEARHAALAHDIARWLDSQLTAEERVRVAIAQLNAHSALRASVLLEPHEDVARIAGIPCSREAMLLVDGLDNICLAA